MKKLKEIKEVKLPVDFCDLVDTLSAADGFTDRVVLYCDENLRAVLEAMKYANKNIRGSYGGGRALTMLYEAKGFFAVEKAVIKFCKKHKIKVFRTKITYHYEEA